jgi:hypothetical protein
MAPLNPDDDVSMEAPPAATAPVDPPLQPETVPDIAVLVKKRPRYLVQVDETRRYCRNIDDVRAYLAGTGRVISTGDVYNTLKIAPYSKYRLLERLNGARQSREKRFLRIFSAANSDRIFRIFGGRIKSKVPFYIILAQHCSLSALFHASGTYANVSALPMKGREYESRREKKKFILYFFIFRPFVLFCFVNNNTQARDYERLVDAKGPW